VKNLPNYCCVAATTQFSFLFLSLSVAPILLGCGRKIEGTYRNTSNQNCSWDRVEIRENGLFVINNGEFLTEYRRDGNTLIVRAGLITAVGEIDGDSIVFRGDVFKKMQSDDIHAKKTSLTENETEDSVNAPHHSPETGNSSQLGNAPAATDAEFDIERLEVVANAIGDALHAYREQELFIGPNMRACFNGSFDFAAARADAASSAVSSLVSAQRASSAAMAVSQELRALLGHRGYVKASAQIRLTKRPQVISDGTRTSLGLSFVASAFQATESNPSSGRLIELYSDSLRELPPMSLERNADVGITDLEFVLTTHDMAGVHVTPEAIKKLIALSISATMSLQLPDVASRLVSVAILPPSAPAKSPSPPSADALPAFSKAGTSDAPLPPPQKPQSLRVNAVSPIINLEQLMNLATVAVQRDSTPRELKDRASEFLEKNKVRKWVSSRGEKVFGQVIEVTPTSVLMRHEEQVTEIEKTRFVKTQQRVLDDIEDAARAFCSALNDAVDAGKIFLSRHPMGSDR
jgi:hypothetical protein